MWLIYPQDIMGRPGRGWTLTFSLSHHRLIQSISQQLHKKATQASLLKSLTPAHNSDLPAGTITQGRYWNCVASGRILDHISLPYRMYVQSH